MSLKSWKREYMRIPNSRVYRYGWARLLREMLHRLEGLRKKNLERHGVSLKKATAMLLDADLLDAGTGGRLGLDFEVLGPPCHKAQEGKKPLESYCSACPVFAANDGYRECEHPKKRQWTRLKKGNPQPMITLFRKTLRMVESGKWKPKKK